MAEERARIEEAKVLHELNADTEMALDDEPSQDFGHPDVAHQIERIYHENARLAKSSATLLKGAWPKWLRERPGTTAYFIEPVYETVEDCELFNENTKKLRDVRAILFRHIRREKLEHVAKTRKLAMEYWSRYKKWREVCVC